MRVRLLMLYPRVYTTPKAPTSDRGTATDGITVARGLRRKRKITMTTRPIVRASSNSTSSTEALMVVVLSLSGWSLLLKRAGCYCEYGGEAP